ncbi:ADP-ribosylation factor-like protein 5A isoform X3 [Calypte anna]|uniref:ADP-ribosylation factor-like protein 5A isoform X3 n=2 Tax=Aves TaxID=8782 RepID=UPI0011C40AEE|nr:ADP-ribosylation factor-like protein 5A isoform X3 [Calypte anna]
MEAVQPSGIQPHLRPSVPADFLTSTMLATTTPETKVPSYVGSEHKVIIVGLDNAGKTTILYQFSMNEVVHTSPTIGSNVEEIVVNNTRFLMWDIGGQESLRSSWNTYYTNTEDLKKAGLLIFANKQDVKECMTVAEISQFLKLTSIKDHQWHIQACCALTGEGLCQGLEWMMSRLKIR